MYWLAEGEHTELHNGSFDASYAWELHHLLNAIARGEKGVAELKEYIAKDAATHPAEAFRLMFTSNHDENSWAGTEFERMGDAAKVMAMLTFTLPNGQPLIYTGQEMGWNKRFEFFEKDHIPAWENNEYTEFYKEMIALRHNNAALAAGERGGKIEYIEEVPAGVFAFTRSVEGNSVTVYANLTNEAVVVGDTTIAAWGWNIITK
jgi:glycosidase